MNRLPLPLPKDKALITPAMYALLPTSIKEMEAQIGFSATMTIVELCGGSHLNLQKRAKDSHSHWLIEHIGVEAVSKLYAFYGNDQLEIPVCKSFQRAWLSVYLRDALQKGVTRGELALQLGMTYRGVCSILERTYSVPTVPNMDLFADL